MSQTFKNPTSAMMVSDLSPLMMPYYNNEAKDVLKNRACSSTIVQWNRPIGDNPYQGEQAAALGKFLYLLKIPSYEDLFTSNYVREVSQVRYYGTTCQRQNLGKAAIAMTNMFNHLAANNLIRGVLSPLMAVELVDGRVVIVSYIAVDQQNEPLVQSMYGNFEFKEGGLPPEHI